VRKPSEKSSAKDARPVEDVIEEAYRDENAVEGAIYRLARLVIDVATWGGQGPNTSSAKSKFEHAVAVMKCIALPYRSRDDDGAVAADVISERVRKAAISTLEEGRTAKDRHGRYADSLAWRDRPIAETVDWLCEQYGYDPTRSDASKDKHESACSITAEALRRVVDWRLREKIPTAALKRIKKFRLSEKTVAEIWKKYRT
jgi:hypothetical protein